ncbi:MAG: group II intron reverse transcriptase/maturase [Verrucomicrobiia bacterium]
MSAIPIIQSAVVTDTLEDQGSIASGAVSKTPTLEEMLGGNNIQSAWHRVRRNRGCAGVDGVTIEELNPVFSEQWRRIEAALRSGAYRPQPLLRVRIPKPAGGERLLGIPTVTDRVVQQALAQVLSPCWESRFSPRSFAYRPGLGPHDALKAFEGAVNRGASWVLHVDIEDFFDSVPHTIAMGFLQDELADQRLATLAQQVLSSGVYENGLVRPASLGLPQGSPLSPLVANVVLDFLDDRLEQGGWEFVRYADDCVVLLASQNLGPAARQLVVESLADLGLRLNERKTAFTHVTEARFLGFAFRQASAGSIVRSVSPEALAEVEQILLQTIQTSVGSATIVAEETAKTLRSWLAYFWTPCDEAKIQAFTDRILAAWQGNYPGIPVPNVLRWKNLRVDQRSRARVDYAGHFQAGRVQRASVDWADSLRCLLLRALRSRWWHVEYDLSWGRRSPGIRLCFGSHRINFRL